MYPRIRMRRKRSSLCMRNLSSEHDISIKKLIQPLFIIEGSNKIENVYWDIKKYTIDKVITKISEIIELGITTIMLFPCVEEKLKTQEGLESLNPDNLICRAIKEIKKTFGNKIIVISDVALDPYTLSGHDGIFENEEVDNDKTIKYLCKQSLVQVESGSDIIAPSDMMDGRIMHIRNILEKNGFQNIPIMSYAVKYCSSLYEPFRNIIGSNNRETKVDKTTYQMDFSNSDEAMVEIDLDIKEGADFIIIKPALYYNDIIYRAKNSFNIPIVAYQVSGEYVMIKNSQTSMFESILSLKRAGASSIITYAACEIAKTIKN